MSGHDGLNCPARSAAANEPAISASTNAPLTDNSASRVIPMQPLSVLSSSKLLRQDAGGMGGLSRTTADFRRLVLEIYGAMQ